MKPLPVRLAALAAVAAAAAGLPGEAAPGPEASPARVIRSADGILTISIPKGALDRNVPVTIRAVRPVLPAALRRGVAPGRSYALGPPGLRFAKPVTITRRVNARGAGAPRGLASLVLATQDTRGKWTLLGKHSIRRSGPSLFVSATARHFSTVVAYEGDLRLTLAPDSVQKGLGGLFRTTLTIEQRGKAGELSDLDVDWAPRASQVLDLVGIDKRFADYRCTGVGDETFSAFVSLHDPSIPRWAELMGITPPSDLVHFLLVGRATCVANRPPTAGPIVGSFVRPQTTYTAEVSDPEGSSLTREWILTPPANDPGCNNQGRVRSNAPAFVWLHGDEHGCDHTKEGPRGHQGVVELVVRDDAWECRARFEGTIGDIGARAACTLR